MNINLEMPETHRCVLKDLPHGTAFTFPTGKELYMVLSHCDCYLDRETRSRCSKEKLILCVEIGTGSIYDFLGESTVFPATEMRVKLKA